MNISFWKKKPTPVNKAIMKTSWGDFSYINSTNALRFVGGIPMPNTIPSLLYHNRCATWKIQAWASDTIPQLFPPVQTSF